MHTKHSNTLLLLPPEEAALRRERVRAAMASAGVAALLIADHANKYYLTGRVFDGHIYLPARGPVRYFVRRPIDLVGDFVVSVRKPEEIRESVGLAVPETLGVELDTLSYSAATRLAGVFPMAELRNASAVMRVARAVKTPFEIEKLRHSGARHTYVYSRIPALYRPGMTDLELQIEIERLSRLQGCLGQFRISGDSMELYMGSLLVGDNADAASPYDFAMGGAGMDPSLPVGADGTPIAPDTTVMVDMNGNYNGYMTDMTRVFALGDIDPVAVKAHECSLAIHRELTAMMRPGVEAKLLWQKAEEMVKEAGLHAYFMGHHQHAGFVGHGLGIEINEAPVIAPRSRDILAEGNVIALEPKFVIPHVGAVGIENTYVIHADSVECLTSAPEQIVSFEY